VIVALQRLGTEHVPLQRLIGTRNRYLIDTTNRVDADTKQGGNLRDRQISEYIAASIFFHCIDGWNYLSRSVAALFNGSPGVAVHLAYYAELRAAMSLLAGDGIGIFNYRHIWLDDVGKATCFEGGGTHVAADFTLQLWSQDRTRASRALDFIRVGGASIRDWITAACGTPSLPSISRVGMNWLRSWSIDLRDMQWDRGLRNAVSYRPRALSVRLECDDTSLLRDLSVVSEFWLASEPSPPDGFKLLDIHLLRQSLHTARTGLPVGLRGTTFPAFVTQACSAVQVGSPRSYERQLIANPAALSVFQLANRQAWTKGFPRRAAFGPLLARSFLLLRLATGAAAMTLRESGIASAQLDFLWAKLGIDQSLWPLGGRPAAVGDLWNDVEDTISALANLPQGADSENVPALGALLGDSEQAFRTIATLQQFHRAFLWSIAA
jgi:hypothetical protein